MRRQRAASGMPAEAGMDQTRYTAAAPASAAIRGCPSTRVIAATASGSGTSASASATALIAARDGASTVTCAQTQSSTTRAARSASIRR
jgi:hypothetical protein